MHSMLLSPKRSLNKSIGMTHFRNQSTLYRFIIQAPRPSRASLVKGRSQANVVAQQALIAHWQSIVKSLNYYLKIMKANHVPPFLVRKVFTYSTGKHECCSFSNGEFVKIGLAELENWCHEATEEYAGSARDELRHIRQAVGILVLYRTQTGFSKLEKRKYFSQWFKIILSELSCACVNLCCLPHSTIHACNVPSRYWIFIY
ncbi:unnamed protein product, partial [Vitis vinifera]